MENLISRWKSSLNSAKKSQSLSESREPNRDTVPNNSNKKNRNLSPTSSSEDESYDRKKFIASLKKDINLTNSRSGSSLQKLEKTVSPRNNAQQQQHNVENTNAMESANKKDLSMSGKKPPKSKKSIAMIIDESAYKIMDIFKYSAELSNQEKFLRIRKIIEELGELHGLKPDDTEDQQSSKLKHESTTIRSSGLFSRGDTSSSKIISELESRLFEGERERVALRNEKDALALKCEQLERELKTKVLNEELVEMIKANHTRLERNNEMLLKELETSNRRQEDQQILWEAEVNDLTNSVEILKRQLKRNEGIKNIDKDQA